MGEVKNQTIGFIGTGVMGFSMIRNLIKAGYSLEVYTRSKEKAMPLLDEGAIWRDSPHEMGQSCDVIITMVGYPKDVEQIYFGEKGLFHSLKNGIYIIDMTTSSPRLAGQIYERARQCNAHALDAPVSGGDLGAREARLSIMAGGDKDAFNAMQPVFNILGTNIVYHGSAGAGQHAKMCNQIAIASNMIGVSEAMHYAKSVGLHPETVLKSIETGAAGSWSLSNLAPRMLKGDFAPGFYIKHFIKDMEIAIEAAEEMGLSLPGLTLARSLYERLVEAGEEDSGTQALFKYYLQR